MEAAEEVQNWAGRHFSLDRENTYVQGVEREAVLALHAWICCKRHLAPGARTFGSFDPKGTPETHRRYLTLMLEVVRRVFSRAYDNKAMRESMGVRTEVRGDRENGLDEVRRAMENLDRPFSMFADGRPSVGADGRRASAAREDPSEYRRKCVRENRFVEFFMEGARPVSEDGQLEPPDQDDETNDEFVEPCKCDGYYLHLLVYDPSFKNVANECLAQIMLDIKAVHAARDKAAAGGSGQGRSKRKPPKRGPEMLGNQYEDSSNGPRDDSSSNGGEDKKAIPDILIRLPCLDVITCVTALAGIADSYTNSIAFETAYKNSPFSDNDQCEALADPNHPLCAAKLFSAAAAVLSEPGKIRRSKISLSSEVPFRRAGFSSAPGFNERFHRLRFYDTRFVYMFDRREASAETILGKVLPHVQVSLINPILSQWPEIATFIANGGKNMDAEALRRVSGTFKTMQNSFPRPFEDPERGGPGSSKRAAYASESSEPTLEEAAETYKKTQNLFNILNSPASSQADADVWAAGASRLAMEVGWSDFNASRTANISNEAALSIVYRFCSQASQTLDNDGKPVHSVYKPPTELEVIEQASKPNRTGIEGLYNARHATLQEASAYDLLNTFSLLMIKHGSELSDRAEVMTLWADLQSEYEVSSHPISFSAPNFLPLADRVRKTFAEKNLVDSRVQVLRHQMHVRRGYEERARHSDSHIGDVFRAVHLYREETGMYGKVRFVFLNFDRGMSPFCNMIARELMCAFHVISVVEHADLFLIALYSTRMASVHSFNCKLNLMLLSNEGGPGKSFILLAAAKMCIPKTVTEMGAASLRAEQVDKDDLGHLTVIEEVPGHLLCEDQKGALNDQAQMIKNSITSCKFSLKVFDMHATETNAKGIRMSRVVETIKMGCYLCASNLSANTFSHAMRTRFYIRTLSPSGHGGVDNSNAERDLRSVESLALFQELQGGKSNNPQLNAFVRQGHMLHALKVEVENLLWVGFFHPVSQEVGMLVGNEILSDLKARGFGADNPRPFERVLQLAREFSVMDAICSLFYTAGFEFFGLEPTVARIASSTMDQHLVVYIQHIVAAFGMLISDFVDSDELMVKEAVRRWYLSQAEPPLSKKQYHARENVSSRSGRGFQIQHKPGTYVGSDTWKMDIAYRSLSSTFGSYGDAPTTYAESLEHVLYRVDEDKVRAKVQELEESGHFSDLAFEHAASCAEDDFAGAPALTEQQRIAEREALMRGEVFDFNEILMSRAVLTGSSGGAPKEVVAAVENARGDSSGSSRRQQSFSASSDNLLEKAASTLRTQLEHMQLGLRIPTMRGILAVLQKWTHKVHALDPMVEAQSTLGHTRTCRRPAVDLARRVPIPATDAIASEREAKFLAHYKNDKRYLNLTTEEIAALPEFEPFRNYNTATQVRLQRETMETGRSARTYDWSAKVVAAGLVIPSSCIFGRGTDARGNWKSGRLETVNEIYEAAVKRVLNKRWQQPRKLVSGIIIPGTDVFSVIEVGSPNPDDQSLEPVAIRNVAYVSPAAHIVLTGRLESSWARSGPEEVRQQRLLVVRGDLDLWGLDLRTKVLKIGKYRIDPAWTRHPEILRLPSVREAMAAMVESSSDRFFFGANVEFVNRTTSTISSRAGCTDSSNLLSVLESLSNVPLDPSSPTNTDEDVGQWRHFEIAEKILVSNERTAMAFVRKNEEAIRKEAASLGLRQAASPRGPGPVEKRLLKIRRTLPQHDDIVTGKAFCYPREWGLDEHAADHDFGTYSKMTDAIAESARTAWSRIIEGTILQASPDDEVVLGARPLYVWDATIADMIASGIKVSRDFWEVWAAGEQKLTRKAPNPSIEANYFWPYSFSHQTIVYPEAQQAELNDPLHKAMPRKELIKESIELAEEMERLQIVDRKTLFNSYSQTQSAERRRKTERDFKLAEFKGREHMLMARVMQSTRAGGFVPSLRAQRASEQTSSDQPNDEEEELHLNRRTAFDADYSGDSTASALHEDADQQQEYDDEDDEEDASSLHSGTLFSDCDSSLEEEGQDERMDDLS